MDRRDSRRTAAAPRRVLALLSIICLAGLAPEEAAAQRPFRSYDPFYRGETANRTFFDHYALTGEVAYRPAGSIRDGVTTAGADPLGLTLRFDYRLLPQLDAGAIVDASGSYSGRRLSLTWVTLKYYRFVENTHYSFRLAVDPAFDGRVGSPQIDLAFIASSALTPLLSSDFALGIRRVRMGYEQIVRSGDVREVVYTRALGLEVHGMMNYSLHFDPAGSNFFVSLLGQGGQYDLVESALRAAAPQEARLTSDVEAFVSGLHYALLSADAAPWTQSYRGGVVWVRGGMEFNRPNYQASPFLSVPLKQWTSDPGFGEAARLHVGLRLMLR